MKHSRKSETSGLRSSPTCGLETMSRGYRIEFTTKPPTTSRVWWTETPKNPSRRADLERGLQSMLDKQAIKEIPVSPETPGFYSPIFLVAKESGSWRLILNLKAFNKFVVPPSFRMETLRKVMDCLGEAAQQRQNTSEHLRDLSLSETWAISIDLRDAHFHVAVVPEHTYPSLTTAEPLSSWCSPSVSRRLPESSQGSWGS